MQPVPGISVVTLFLNADVVVKGVLLLLLVASVWSWAVIIDKLWRLGAASRAAREHEVRAAAARSPEELSATEGRDPAGLVISAAVEVTHGLRVEGSESPGIERTEPHASFAPFDGAVSFAALAALRRPALA